MVETWHHDRLCRGTPILVNLDNSPEVDERFSKSGLIISYLTAHRMGGPKQQLCNTPPSDPAFSTYD